MKKKKTSKTSLDSVLKEFLIKDEFRLAYEERKFYLKVAKLVSELRAKSGMSQAEVADRAGVSQPLVARLEKGDHRRTPTFDTIHKILNAMGYTLSISVKPKKAA